MTVDTPRGLQPFQPGPGAQQSSEGKPYPGTDKALASSSTVKQETNHSLRRNIYDSTGKQVGDASQANGHVEESEKKQYNCFSCGVDCTRVRYHSAKSKKYELCPNCYLEGRFPQNTSSTDFVKMEDISYSAHDRDAPWTDQETLLLLEGLELHDDDWNKIADHVGTRTREQCVVHFLQLPIEDKFLEEKPELLGPLQYDRIPFSQAGNPVTGVVAFLASLADPKIAAATAGTSISEVTKSLRERATKNGAKDSPAPKDGGDKSSKPSTPAAGPSSAFTDPTASTTHADDQSETITKPETDANASMDVDVSDAPSADKTNTLEGDADPQQSALLNKVITTTFGSIATRGHILASNEERETGRLIYETINANLRKLETKVAHFTELESILHAERKELELQRQQLFLDRLAMKKQVVQVVEMLRAAQEAPAGGQERMNMLNQAEGVMFGSAAGGGFEGSKIVMTNPTVDGLGSTRSVAPLSQAESGNNFSNFEV